MLSEEQKIFLIRQIKERPVLWNINNENYNKFHLKTKMFLKIRSNMITEFKVSFKGKKYSYLF